jgi:hypothetical protein
MCLQTTSTDIKLYHIVYQPYWPQVSAKQKQLIILETWLTRDVVNPTTEIASHLTIVGHCAYFLQAFPVDPLVRIQ